jgi:hypothetical protein
MDSKELLVSNIRRKKWGSVNIIAKLQSEIVNEETFSNLSPEEIYYVDGLCIKYLEKCYEDDTKMVFEGRYEPAMASMIPYDSYNYSFDPPNIDKCTVIVRRADDEE